MADTTWTQRAGMVSDEDTDNLESYADQAEASKDAAAVSAAAAEAAKVAAAASEAAALASKNSAATSATTATTGAATATTKASEAATSAASASTSATGAQTAQTAAEAAETAAAASETASAASAAAASTSEANAATSASAASTSATNAGTSETNAATSASAASTSETNAAASETAASASETAAATSETNAATSESNAASSASAASTSASNAATSESNAASSASAASTSETNAAASETAAATSETNAASSASAAATSASDAAASAASVNPDSIDINGGTIDGTVIGGTTPAAGSFTNTQLAEIAASKAVTAVDVFVYDTSNDSDGGAWRKRTQGTSWYNETLNTATRGSRKEFPAVAVIVAEAAKVTIYDGDDPALPMWMVFNPAAPGTANGPYIYAAAGSRHLSSVSFANGQMNVGSTLSGGVGLFSIDFLEDAARLYTTSIVSPHKHGQAIAGRNLSVTGQGYAIAEGGRPIINNAVNDVAMTVLPDAPIDPATGLPVPTIAVATDGGVSVITHGGDVWDITPTDAYKITSHVIFTDDNEVMFAWDNDADARFISVYNIPTADVSTGAFGYNSGSAKRFYTARVASVGVDLIIGPSITAVTDITKAAVGQVGGLTLLAEDPVTPANGMVAYTTSTYNTGWMNGDIKGAFLSDTDDTDLVGSGELVTNGTFDTDLTGWTENTSGVVTWDASGAAKVGGGTGVTNTTFSQTITGLTAGVTYALSFDITQSSGTGAGVRVYFDGDSMGGGVYYTTSQVFYVTPTSNSAELFFYRFRNSTGEQLIDNISVKLADADRSVNNNGLIVNGTVTRSPVATGADLVAYSGFSASNYLEQPYNSDLDFGTGDFCVMGWFKLNANGTYFVFDKQASPPNRFTCYTSSGKLRFLTDGVDLLTTPTYGDAQWRLVSIVRNSGVSKIYVNGLEVVSGSDTGDVSSSNPLRLGLSLGGTAAFNGSLALFRISATAPTAEQIAKIYNDEKVLFQENAQATLYGSSDAVTALAHDDATNLLHVGTSAGRSVFQGLRRVSNTTTAVGTAISVSNGLVVEE